MSDAAVSHRKRKQAVIEFDPALREEIKVFCFMNDEQTLKDFVHEAARYFLANHKPKNADRAARYLEQTNQ